MKKLLLLSSTLLACCLTSSVMASYYQWFRIKNDMGKTITFRTFNSCFKYGLTGTIKNGQDPEYQAEASQSAFDRCIRKEKHMTFQFSEAGKDKYSSWVKIICSSSGDSDPTCKYDSEGSDEVPKPKVSVTSSGRYLHMKVSTN